MAAPLSIPHHWQREVPLAPRTSWKIGGAARYFSAPKTVEQAAETYTAAAQLQLPLLVLGKGSNLIISDHGWEGLVLSLADHLQQLELLPRLGNEGWVLQAEAGALLNTATVLAARNGAAGLERLAGIPGSVGGAVMMNAGAYGATIADTLLKVTACDKEGKQQEFSLEESALGYRQSRFQQGDLLILKAEFQLEKGDPLKLQSEMMGLLVKRKKSQPLEYPSGGSLFKRPEGDFAGRLIEAAGLKGFRVGDAAISTKHANFAVNLGNATAQEVHQLAQEVIRRVELESGIALEPEQLFVGRFD